MLTHNLIVLGCMLCCSSADMTTLQFQVQKRMMVAEQLVPSSPLVTAAQLGVPITPAGGYAEEALLAKKARLQECMASHNAQIQVGWLHLHAIDTFAHAALVGCLWVCCSPLEM